MTYNLQAVETATATVLAAGIRVLNPFLLADTEREHVQILLQAMDPPEGAVVLDAGCGVGEVAHLMAQDRPDLEFRLLNVSQLQLSHCPEGMERIVGSFDAMPLPDACVDVVMFNFSLCHADDWGQALREAFRVLKPQGTLFIFDMARDGGSNTLLNELLQAGAYDPVATLDVAERAGFDVGMGQVLHHKPVAEIMRPMFAEPALYDAALAGVYPITMRFTAMPRLANPVADAFQRHRRIAFEFSGGRDSTAALFLLRPWWDQMTVYHLDTGDQFPETRAVVHAVEALLPLPIVRIYGDVQAVREQHGLPSDVVPVDCTALGRMVSGRPVKLQSRYDCCARALMNPMHARMQADAITLIVRGQRDDEYDAPPLRSGATANGVEFLYPIERWNADQVMAYLQAEGLPVAAFYERGMRRGPECMGCTAWWDEGRADYLREHHPAAYTQYLDRMAVVQGEINRQLRMLDHKEVCHG